MPVTRRARCLLAATLLALATLAGAALAPAARADTPDARLAAAQQAFAAAAEHAADPARSRAAYREAARKFQAIHDEDGVVSARLFVDTANAYAFAGDLGEAALWYRRALVLDPHEPRATQGLTQLRRQLPWQRPVNASENLLESLFFWHEGVSFAARRALFLLLWPAAFALFWAARRKRSLLAPAALAAVAGAALAVSSP